MAHFLFPEYRVRQDPLHIAELLEPGIRSLGYELVGVEYQTGGKGGGLLRVYIDKEEGISADDCQKVSYQVSGILEVEDPINGQYSLEVSSPGMDRPLFTLEHFTRYVGSNVKVRLRQAVLGRRKFTALIEAVENDEIVLVDETGEAINVHVSDVEKANIVPEI